MAQPRVFISSTCYDLAEVRDTLIDFVLSFGFEAVLSERGDVFYHPDIHTHDSCLNEIGNCQLLILIIGGRFGGSYVADSSKSIVNAEYSAARERKIPVFTFVKRSVHSDHFVYQKNKGREILSDIVFPSIDDNRHASRIFDFIDEVRQSPVNNGFFPFEFARDISSLLRKQWAGMFYEFLEHRSSSDQLATATALLKNISIAGDKVEDLVKNLYRHVDTAGADEKIDSVEKRSTARQFFLDVIDFMISPVENLRGKFLDTPMNGKWYDYVAAATGGKIKTGDFSLGRDNEEQEIQFIDWGGNGRLVNCPQDPNDPISVRSRQKQKEFEVVRALRREELEMILTDIDKLQRNEGNQQRKDNKP